MSSVETLENLSNAELRLKCIEYGLPNVPVTDSSRKLLLKRLRDSMNKDNTGKETTTKSSNRRETIHVSKTAPAAETVNEPLSLSQTAKSRRTIAATAPAITKDDTANAAPTSIPISTRRRSVQKEAEPKPVKAASKGTTPMIVIEDDEEDVDLVTAVENAEKESTTSSVPIETISSRRKSRSASVPKVTEVVPVAKKRAMTPLVEEKIEKPKTITTKAKAASTVEVSNNNATSQKSYQPTISTFSSAFTQPIPKTPVDMTGGNWYGVYDQQQNIASSQPVSKTGFDNTMGRYSMQSTTSTVYSSPAMRYSIGGLASSMPSYRAKYSTADILNEQSDTDVNNDDGPKSPFLSSFARNLERSKSVGRSTSGSGGHYRRQSGTNYDSIRGRRSQNELTLRELIIGLNRRYKLKTVIVVLALLSLSILVYVWRHSS